MGANSTVSPWHILQSVKSCMFVFNRDASSIEMPCKTNGMPSIRKTIKAHRNGCFTQGLEPLIDESCKTCKREDSVVWVDRESGYSDFLKRQ